MPSKSPEQRRLMQAAAHTPGGYGGVPQSVGREFVQADKLQQKRPASNKMPGFRGKTLRSRVGK